MKSVQKKWLAAAMVLAVVGLAVPAQAEEGNPFMKLGRGIANIGFGPLEILIRPYDVAQRQGNIAALTYGIISGVGYTVAREVVGVIDVVTFPMPLPGCTEDPLDEGWGYGPLMRPAWVIDTDHNAFDFFYNDDSMLSNH